MSEVSTNSDANAGMTEPIRSEHLWKIANTRPADSRQKAATHGPTIS